MIFYTYIHVKFLQHETIIIIIEITSTYYDRGNLFLCIGHLLFDKVFQKNTIGVFNQISGYI